MTGNSERHSIDDFFLEKLGEHRVPAPAGTWETIEDSLERKNKRRILIPWIAASVIALFSAFGLGYYMATLRMPAQMVKEFPENIETSPVNKEEKTIHAGDKVNSNDSHKMVANENNMADSDQGKTMHENFSPSRLTSVSSSNTLAANQEIIPSKNPDKSDQMVYLNPRKGFIEYDRTPVPGLKVFSHFDEPISVTENNEQKQVNFAKWSLGFQGAPVFAYRTLTASSSSPVDPSYYNSVENPLLAYSFGINLNYKPAKRLSVRTGLYYSKMGQSINNLYTYSHTTGLNLNTEALMQKGANLNSPVSNSTGEINSGINNFILIAPSGSYSSSYQELLRNNTSDFAFANRESYPGYQPIDASLIQSFNYLELPVQLWYKLVNRKIDISVSGGLTGNILTGNNVLLEYEGARQQVGHTEGLKNFNLSMHAGLGFSLPVNNMLEFSLEPSFNYFLTPVNQSTMIMTRPWSFGLFTGLQFRL